MKLSDLKKQSNIKVLLKGISGTGKTKTLCETGLLVSRAGYRVLYIDTESEGSTTMVKLIENPDVEFAEDDLENLEYVQVGTYDGLMEYIDPDNGYHDEYDLIIIDTLDHKHTFTLRKVIDEQDAQNADWNEYPRIYGAEKNMMEKIGKPKTNIMASLDPESGKIDKPKGTQTNIHGHFNIVFNLVKDGDEWFSLINNYVGRTDVIGGKVKSDDVPEKMADEILDRSME